MATVGVGLPDGCVWGTETYQPVTAASTCLPVAAPWDAAPVGRELAGLGLVSSGVALLHFTRPYCRPRRARTPVGGHGFDLHATVRTAKPPAGSTIVGPPDAPSVPLGAGAPRRAPASLRRRHRRRPRPGPGACGGPSSPRSVLRCCSSARCLAAGRSYEPPHGVATVVPGSGNATWVGPCTAPDARSRTLDPGRPGAYRRCRVRRDRSSQGPCLTPDLTGSPSFPAARQSRFSNQQRAHSLSL